jgi:hypothetical protein
MTPPPEHILVAVEDIAYRSAPSLGPRQIFWAFVRPEVPQAPLRQTGRPLSGHTSTPQSGKEKFCVLLVLALKVITPFKCGRTLYMYGDFLNIAIVLGRPAVWV